MPARSGKWHADGFVAEASHYALDLHRVPHVDVADHVGRRLGKASWSTLAAYLLRRFGPPNMGSDDDREIARWRITTPMDGVHVTAFVKPGPLGLIFHVDATRAVLDVVAAEDRRRAEAEREAYRLWSVATYGDEPPHLGMGVMEYYALDEETRKASERVNAERRTRHLAEAPEARVREDPRDHPETARIREAAERTITDLLRAVPVRDHDINATGDVDGSRLPAAERYRNAGRWLPAHAYTDPMTDVLEAAERLGGGDEGMARVAAIVAREAPEDGAGAYERMRALVQRLVDEAHPDGNSRPHPSDYWRLVVIGKRLLADTPDATTAGTERRAEEKA